jgi:WD40 repeat protein
VAFTPDGRSLITSYYGQDLRWWDLSGSPVRTTFAADDRAIDALEFSPDAPWLTAASGDGTTRQWNLDTRQTLTTRPGDGDRIFATAYSQDRRRIAVAYLDGTLTVTDQDGRTELTVRKAGSEVPRALAFAADGHGLLLRVSTGVVLQDLAGGVPRTVATTENLVDWVAFSPDGRRIAVDNDRDPAWIQDASTGPSQRTVLNSTPDTRGPLAFSPDGQRLVTGGTYRLITLWDVSSGHRRIISGGPQNPAGPDLDADWFRFGPDSRTLAVGWSDGTISVWESATGRWHVVSDERRTDLPNGPLGTDAVAFSPDGRTFAAAGFRDGTVRLWDTATWLPRPSPQGTGAAPVTALAFAPDGQHLALGNEKGEVQVWRLATPTPQQAIDQICHALHRDLTPDERTRYVPTDLTQPACPST